MQWLQSISVFSSTKLLAAADCEMVYFIRFLILTIVLPAFFVTAAPVRVTRLRDITEPQARKTLREGLIVLWNAAVSLLAIYKIVFHKLEFGCLGMKTAAGCFTFQCLFYPLNNKRVPSPDSPNMEGLTSLCDALNLSQQLLKVNNTQLLLPSRSTDMPVSGSVAMPYALLSFQYIDNASQHSTMH